jgi:methionyl aminopeptidase
MIIIKNKSSIQKMAQAGILLHDIFHAIKPLIKEGVTTLSLDAFIQTQLKEKGLVSRMKGYKGYRHVSCISVNDVVVHGIPSAKMILKNGDLVKIDVCASWQGYCADMARAFLVGDAPPQVVKLVAVAQEALNKGIEQAYAGKRLSDISGAIGQEVEKHGFGVVRDFAGHGIGKSMHEDPEIVNYKPSEPGPVLRPGMAFALEPMITLGNYEVEVMNDGWTVKTVDNSLAAHVEDTIVITQGAPLILTRGNDNNGSSYE